MSSSYTSSPPSAFMACGGTALTGYILRNIRSYVGKYFALHNISVFPILPAS
jgi:hypothetical protein